MRLYALLFVLALCATTLASAIPKQTEGQEADHKNRVHDQKLSEQEHFAREKEEDGEEDEEDGDEDEEEHNHEYDHEAFLGREDARRFEQLSPEESMEKLALIYDKIDKDADGFVTEDELRDWIKHVQKRYITEDTERQWKEHNVDGDTITWEAYKTRTYGNVQEEQDDEEDPYNYVELIRRDRRRWEKADQDGDDILTKEQFADFLHPEEAEHMKSIVVDETLEDIDKDKDGLISLQEYLDDMWPDKNGEEEPDWVKTEREQFANFRDKNKDGNMDRDEVADWILPSDYDHAEAETKHLIHESDVDRDGKLTKEEVVNKYDLFVGSQATDFGEALARHDEF